MSEQVEQLLKSFTDDVFGIMDTGTVVGFFLVFYVLRMAGGGGGG